MIEVFDCVQGTREWHQARAGVPTASEFATVMASGRGGGPSVTRRKYMLQLLGERITGEVVTEGYSNAAMERGKAMEQEARDLYEFRTDNALTQVGFMLDTDTGAGASPDSLIGDDGLLEIKTKLPHLQLDCLLTGALPSDHKAQVQGQLWVTGRKWVDFVSYWPKLPLFCIRVERDEPYIAQIADAVAAFRSEMDVLHARFA